MKEFKEYKYRLSNYFIDVFFTNIILAIVSAFCLMMILAKIYQIVALIGLVVSFYSIWSILIAKREPLTVLLSEEKIVLIAFAKKEEYKFSDLCSMRIREYANKSKMYIRLREKSGITKSYWINTARFTDGNELFVKLQDLEKMINPNLLKYKIREHNNKVGGHSDV